MLVTLLKYDDLATEYFSALDVSIFPASNLPFIFLYCSANVSELNPGGNCTGNKPFSSNSRRMSIGSPVYPKTFFRRFYIQQTKPHLCYFPYCIDIPGHRITY